MTDANTMPTEVQVDQAIQNAVQSWKSFYSFLNELASMMDANCDDRFLMDLQQSLAHPDSGINFNEVLNLPRFVSKRLGIGDVH